MKRKIAITLFLALLTTTLYAQNVGGTTVADIANGLIPQFKDGVAPLMEALSYIFGIMLGIKGILKLKEHNESKGQVKITIAIALIVSSAFFLSLPQFINTGISTFGFDQGGQQTFKF